MNKISTFLLIWVSTLFIVSCNVKDDLDDCFYTANVNIDFEYFADTNPKNNVLSTYITSARLFVYKDGILFHEYEINKEELNSLYKLQLPEGNFKLVCWGNYGENTEVQNKASDSEAKISALGYINSTEIKTNDKLYYSTKAINIPDFSSNKEVSITERLSFTSSTAQFIISSKGFKNRNIKIAIDNLTPQLDFNNQSVKPYNTTYYPPVTQSDLKDVIVNSAYTFRFGNANPIEIRLIEIESDGNSKILKSVELEQLLQESNIDVNNKQEISLNIEFEATTKGIEVTMKEWEGIPIIPGN